MCDVEHIVPVEGFGENRIMQRMLQMNLEKLDPSCYLSYKSAKESYEYLQKKLNLFESIQKYPVDLIENYFFELKQKINGSKNDLKQEIDDHYEKLFHELELHRIECIKDSEKNKELSHDELNYLKQAADIDFKILEMNETKWKDIEKKSKALTHKIEFKITETINYFLLNKTYDFVSPFVKLGHLMVKPVESLTDFNQNVSQINNSLVNKLLEGNWEKYKLINYDEIKYDVNESQLNHLDTDDFIKQMLMDASQIKHLNFIKKMESDLKPIKNYIILRRDDFNYDNHAVICVVYKNVNPNYQNEFLNNLGFAILLKNPQFEKI